MENLSKLGALTVISQSLNPSCKNCVYNLNDSNIVDCESRNVKFKFKQTLENENKIFNCFHHKLITEKIQIEKTTEYSDEMIEKIGKKIANDNGVELLKTTNKKDEVIYWLDNFKNI